MYKKTIHSNKNGSHSKKKERVKANLAAKFLSALLIIVLISVFALILGKENTTQAGESIKYNKYFKSIEINSGDTLWSIAKENIPQNSSIDIRDYINEVSQINSLSGGEITSGMNLVVPYYAE